MLFNSYVFIFAFLPLSLICFYLQSSFSRTAAAVTLVVTSLAFYSWWSPQFVALLAASVCLNYVASQGITALASRPLFQSVALGVAIAGDVAVLIYYKYLVGMLHVAMGLGLIRTGTTPDIVLPLGISFFTFTQIGYLVDVKQEVAKDRGFLNYVLFVTFFPHLIAGPILHNREMMPQFAEKTTYRFSADNLMVGITIFVIGLAKKSLLADPIAPVVADGFAHASHLSLLASWNSALCFSLQLYFDFSGYTDMATGVARMFNIRFPANFNSPFKATSIIDHWQRWHMTLSRYLALYIYNPIALAVSRWRFRRGLGIDRQAQSTRTGFITMVMFPIFITMAVAGIWHGDGWQFLIFGLLHAAYLTVNHSFRILRPSAPAAGPENWLQQGSKVLATYISVVVAMVFFRASSVGAALSILAGMAGLHGLGTFAIPAAVESHLGTVGQHLIAHGTIVVESLGDCAANVSHLLWVIVLYVIVWRLPNTQQIMRRFSPVIGRIPASPTNRLTWSPTRGWALATAMAACVGLLAIGGTSEFLYFRF